MVEGLFQVDPERLTPLERDFTDFVGRRAVRVVTSGLTPDIEAARQGEYSADGLDQVVPFNHVRFELEQESEQEDEDPPGVYHSIELAIIDPPVATGDGFTVRGVRTAMLDITLIYNPEPGHSFFTSRLGRGTESDDQTSEPVIRGILNGLDKLEREGRLVPYGTVGGQQA